MVQFAGNAEWAESSPLYAHRARPIPLTCENQYMVLTLWEEIAVQAEIGSIVWALTQAQKTKESGDERTRLRAS